MNIEGFGLALFSQNFNKKDQIKISHQLIFEAFASIFFIFYLTFLLLHPKKSSNNISKRACSVFSVYTPPTWGCDWPALWMPVVEGGGPKHLLQLPRHAPRYTAPETKGRELIKGVWSSWKVEGGGPRHLLQLPRHTPGYTAPETKGLELMKGVRSSWKEYGAHERWREVALSTSSSSLATTPRDTPHL